MSEPPENESPSNNTKGMSACGSEGIEAGRSGLVLDAAAPGPHPNQNERATAMTVNVATVTTCQRGVLVYCPRPMQGIVRSGAESATLRCLTIQPMRVGPTVDEASEPPRPIVQGPEWGSLGTTSSRHQLTSAGPRPMISRWPSCANPVLQRERRQHPPALSSPSSRRPVADRQRGASCGVDKSPAGRLLQHVALLSVANCAGIGQRARSTGRASCGIVGLIAPPVPNPRRPHRHSRLSPCR